MVPSRSSSSAAPSRANRRSRRSASLMLRVPSSTVSSRLRNSRLSQTFTARRWRALVLADAHAFGVVAMRAERRGAGRCRSTCCRPGGGPSARPAAAAASPSACPSRRAPRSAAFSSSVSSFSASLRSHSAGQLASASALEHAVPAPLKMLGEDAVEAVEVALVLHQRRRATGSRNLRRCSRRRAPRAPRAASGTR